MNLSQSGDFYPIREYVDDFGVRCRVLFPDPAACELERLGVAVYRESLGKVWPNHHSETRTIQRQKRLIMKVSLNYGKFVQFSAGTTFDKSVYFR